MADAQSILGNNGNITKVQNTYLRHKVMAEAEDEVTMEAPSTEYMWLLPNRLGDLLLVTKHVLACAILVGENLVMIAADEMLVVPVILILFDDAHEAFNIRFYLRFLFDFKERDDLPLHILNFPKLLFN